MQVIGGSTHVLLAVEDRGFAASLGSALTHAGFATTTVATATEALATTRRAPADVVLLDLALPGDDGHRLCERLRRHADAPIVRIVKSVAEADRDAGLDGADDYLVKPVTRAGTVSRIRAVLRRAEHETRAVIRVGTLAIDRDMGEVQLDGEEVQLSPKEIELLARLARDAGAVVTCEQLMRDVWNTTWLGATKTLGVHIGMLRRKLGDDLTHQRFIRTVRGVGFRFASNEELTA